MDDGHEAKAQFQKNWDAWKAWAKLEEMRPAAVAVQAIPVTAAAFFATRLSFEPVFRSVLFAVFLTFDKDPDLLRFFMCSSVCP